MITQQQAETSLEALSESRSEEELNQNLTKICNNYSVDRFAIVAFFDVGQNQKEFDFYNTYPPEWIDHYIKSEYYLHDPIHVWGKIQLPFSWGKNKFQDLTPIQEKMFYESHDFGIDTGTTIPLLPSYNEQSFFTVLDVVHPNPEILQTLTLSSQIYWNTKRQIKASYTLDLFTTREREVLYLKSEGMPIKVVADRLSISESTVIFHIKNARQKLRASSVDHALYLFGRAVEQSKFNRPHKSASYQKGRGNFNSPNIDDNLKEIIAA